MSAHIVRRALPCFVAGVALLVATGCLGADDAADTATSRITVSDAYVPEPPGEVAAAYLRITNEGEAEDTLRSIRSDDAASAELHETTMDGGTVSMHPVESLAIPTGETVALEPGGFHVMLIDPVAPLEEGDQVRLVLTFEVVGEVEVLADVVATGGPR